MDYFFLIIVWPLLVFTFFASIKLAVEGIYEIPKNQFVNFITSPYWCFFLIVLVGTVGDFARGESSPIPWKAFMDVYSVHGIWNGFFALLTVITTDLWLFWIPSQMYMVSLKKTEPVSFWNYVNNRDNASSELKEVVNYLESINVETFNKANRQKIIFARIINLLAGLILTAPNNTFYRFVEML